MSDNAWQAFRGWVGAHIDLALAAEQWEQLRSYLDTLLTWNRKLALVSQSDERQIITKHLADSLFAASLCVDEDAIIDLGSGAGFPALPIAIARPAARVRLIESRGKKASFLEEARRAASIHNALVCHARIEAIAKSLEHRSQYSVVTARALTKPEEFLKFARPFLGAGGRAMAMCSAREDLTQMPSGSEIVDYNLPDGTPRRLVISKLTA
jgi:16S rRNA (guanine527-N7)-methyltransferase